MERKRIPVAIIAGGDSSEYDISLKSAQNVLDHIDKKRFDAEGIGIPYPQQDVHLYIQDTPMSRSMAQSGSPGHPGEEPA